MFLTARIVAAALALAAASVSPAAPVPADRAKAERRLAAVAAKLCGSWQGGPCEGRITFRENGTYEWTGIGPGGCSHGGVWSLSGDPEKPTLVMQSEESRDAARVGVTTKRSVVRVGDEEFEFKDSVDAPERVFGRVKPKQPRGP